MRTFTPWLAVLYLCFFCSFAGAADAAPPHSPHEHDHDGSTPVDRSLARQCLAQARRNSEAGDLRIADLLYYVSYKDIERLAVLVREELGTKAVHDAAAVPPRGDLRAAWLLNSLGIYTETLAFDLATDGRIIRRIGPGGRYLFREFGPGQAEIKGRRARGTDKGKELVLRMDASTEGLKDLLLHKKQEGVWPYSRVYLRKMPGSAEYYVASWEGLRLDAKDPPEPNPDGRHRPGLMNQWRW